MTRNQLNVKNGIQMATVFKYFSWVFFNSKQLAIIIFYMYDMIGQKKVWKQIHKYNLYKSSNTFVRESEEGETTWKLIFLGHHSFFITTKRFTSESVFSKQLVKLYWEYGIGFYHGSVQSDEKCPRCSIILD